MLKILTALLLLQISAVTHAEECASNVAQLKNIVGNSALPLTWTENTSNKSRQLTLRLGNAGGVMSLDLSVPGGNWAKVKGVICSTGNADSYIAKVTTMSWGSEAPGIVKFAGKPKTISLKLPYQSLLKVKAKGMSFEFSPQ